MRNNNYLPESAPTSIEHHDLNNPIVLRGGDGNRDDELDSRVVRDGGEREPGDNERYFGALETYDELTPEMIEGLEKLGLRVVVYKGSEDKQAFLFQTNETPPPQQQGVEAQASRYTQEMAERLSREARQEALTWQEHLSTAMNQVLYRTRARAKWISRGGGGYFNRGTVSTVSNEEMGALAHAWVKTRGGNFDENELANFEYDDHGSVYKVDLSEIKDPRLVETIKAKAVDFKRQTETGTGEAYVAETPAEHFQKLHSFSERMREEKRRQSAEQLAQKNESIDALTEMLHSVQGTATELKDTVTAQAETIAKLTKGVEERDRAIDEVAHALTTQNTEIGTRGQNLGEMAQRAIQNEIRLTEGLNALQEGIRQMRDSGGFTPEQIERYRQTALKQMGGYRSPEAAANIINETFNPPEKVENPEQTEDPNIAVVVNGLRAVASDAEADPRKVERFRNAAVRQLTTLLGGNAETAETRVNQVFTEIEQAKQAAAEAEAEARRLEQEEEQRSRDIKIEKLEASIETIDTGPTPEEEQQMLDEIAYGVANLLREGASNTEIEAHVKQYRMGKLDQGAANISIEKIDKAVENGAHMFSLYNYKEMLREVIEKHMQNGTPLELLEKFMKEAKDDLIRQKGDPIEDVSPEEFDTSLSEVIADLREKASITKTTETNNEPEDETTSGVKSETETVDVPGFLRDRAREAGMNVADEEETTEESEPEDPGLPEFLRNRV